MPLAPMPDRVESWYGLEELRFTLRAPAKVLGNRPRECIRVVADQPVKGRE
jgi:hypothetical protein